MGYLFYQVFQFKHEATVYLGIHRSVKAHQILLEGHISTLHNNAHRFGHEGETSGRNC